MTYLNAQTQKVAFEKDVYIDKVLPDLPGSHKDQVLKNLSDQASQVTSTPAALIYQDLKMQDQNEAFAASGGVAFPALKLKDLKTTICIFARLEDAQDFHAIDHKPIDLICLLCAPADQNALYLRRLSRLTRVFKNKDLCDKIRATNDHSAIQSIVQNPSGWMLAA